jgi:hypothetical protein
VKAIWRRTGRTSSGTLAIAPIRADQAPAAQITTDVAMDPFAVWTAVISPPRTSMPVTSQCSTIRRPLVLAAPAQAAIASDGRA